jgi:hypothetical protein
MSKVWSDQYGSHDSCQPKLHRHIISTGSIDYNTGSCRATEATLDAVNFKILKFTQVNEDDLPPYLFINCLVEFGCETLLPHYFLPTLQHKKSTYRIVCVGWQGREVLYENFADEFWAIDPKFNYLRNYTRAFAGFSKNIRNIEKALAKFGFVYKCATIGNYFLKNDCPKCLKIIYGVDIKKCPQCKNGEIKRSILGDVSLHKKKYVHLDLNLEKYKFWVNEVIHKKTIGIFARGRVTYGRNLSDVFYINLIRGIKDRGYDVIWIGEKESTLPCPVSDVFDFTKCEYSNDLGRCLALVQNCAATFQAWTASTRLSQIVNTPYCLVESPDQLYGRGQEGRRLYLLTPDMNNKKIILSDYAEVKTQQLEFSTFCLDNFFDFLENKNSNDIVGYVSNIGHVKSQMKENSLW